VSELLDPRRVGVEACTLDEPFATFSIDIETDYGTGRDEALSQLHRFLDLIAELDVPLTAFVEGQFFENRQDVPRLLLEHDVDVQLHCYDHGEPGDTPESLRRGAAVFADFCGRRPAGYRANTYRLTDALFDTLREEGFKWDSSVMRALAQGRNTHPEFAQGDYFVLAGDFFEFPMARWRVVPLAFNHSYRLLIKRPAEALLRAFFGLGRLVAYNTHMTDMVRCDSLEEAQRGLAARLGHRYLWALQGDDTFASFRNAVAYLRRKGYRFESTDGLYRRLSGGPG
jgi:peptidoglycan/xylan/chitin deacetylase (PgdA/CDA1 family)